MKKYLNSSWNIAYPFTVILAILGILTGYRDFYIAMILPLLVLVFKFFSSRNSDNLIFRRSIEEVSPSPGREVEVELEVENEGDKSVIDLRLIDGVPEELEVSSESPRGSITLRPGEAKKVSYSVIARRGKHYFGEVDAVDRKGGEASKESFKVEGDDEIDCKPILERVKLRDNSIEQPGDIETTKAGGGIEFHSLREYRGGDSVSRIEWKHFAKTGELATKNFKDEKSREDVIVLDARKVSEKKAGSGHPLATDLSIYATLEIYSLLRKMRHKPGLVILGVDTQELDTRSDSNSLAYISPGNSLEKKRRVEKMLEEVQEISKNEEEEINSKLYNLLPSKSQLIFLTPLLDDDISSSIELMDRNGYQTTVISPDITYFPNNASKLANIKRDLRIERLNTFCNTVDWNIKRPLSQQIKKSIRSIENRG